MGEGSSWRAGVGRVGNLAFLNSLRWLLNESVRIRASHFCHAQVVCQQPANYIPPIHRTALVSLRGLALRVGELANGDYL